MPATVAEDLRAGKLDEWIEEGVLIPTEEGAEDVEPPVKIPQVVHDTPWTLDPASLKNKDLDVLNIMVRERDPKLGPFDTEEEAIAILSRDYGG